MPAPAGHDDVTGGGVVHAGVAATAVKHAARPLAAERRLILIPRDEQAARIAAAIAETSALDAKLANPEPAPTTQSLSRVGTLERFPCQYEDGFVAWRYHGVGGRDLVVRLPAELDTEATDADVRRFMTAVLARQYRE